MIDHFFKFLDYLTKSENYNIKALVALVALIVIFSLKRGSFEKTGKAAGILMAIVVAFLKWPAKALLGFLLFCVLFVTLVPSEARAANRNRVIEVGILFICAVIAPGDASCANVMLYGEADALRTSRSAPEMPVERRNVLAASSKAQAERAEGLLLAPANILPVEQQQFRDDVEQFSDVFGLPAAIDEEAPAEDAQVGPPIELLPSALAESAQVTAEG